MEDTDSGQGQKTWDLSPSLKGRQRKKNSRYSDYETNDTDDVLTEDHKESTKSSGAPKKTPAKRGRPRKATQQSADRQPASPGSDGNIPEKTPAKAKKTASKKTPSKKTPSRKTPAKRTPARPKDGSQVAGDGAVQQENEKPKRKYVRKQVVKEEVVLDCPGEKNTAKPVNTPEEQEVGPGGRHRRSAAKVALKYLHALAQELSHNGDESQTVTKPDTPPPTARPPPKGGRGRRSLKSKHPGSDSSGDEDFVPKLEEEEEEEAQDAEDDEEEESDSEFFSSTRTPSASHVGRGSAASYVRCPNGLPANVMKIVWDAIKANKKFREEYHSSWVFPDWIPSVTSWHRVPQSDVDQYLPQELQSAAFKVSRTGLKEDESLQRLSRFGGTAAHPERWDMSLFAGGPVWALEWCPTPGGAPASQYVALSCHRGMDEQHYANRTYRGPALVQLWDLGPLESSSRPDSQPALAFCLAQDKGFIWQLKWCPSGGWEPPSSRAPPSLPRLGLLAVAGSTGIVTVYSLPHPDALRGCSDVSGENVDVPPVYKADAVLTLKLGAVKAPRNERSGQVLAMDWLPQKPHDIIAIGFYDGVVGLWNLSAKSTLLQVREADESLTLLPYRCFLAHDHAVRALAFCPASRHLLVTAGEDRYVKAWDTRRLYEPTTVQKRYLTNEVCWPLNAPGLLWAQENTYCANTSHGVHYVDHLMQSFFAIPRSATVWSISYTDWLNSIVTSDTLGELILALLPPISFSPQYVKHTIDRRFPIFITSLLPFDPTEEETQEVGGAPGGGADAAAAGPEDGGEDGVRTENDSPTYRDAVRARYLFYTDNDMRTFSNSHKRPVWKHMKSTELKATVRLDELPLAAIHKVRFSPNMSCHTWVASGGQAGLVRLHCVRGLNGDWTRIHQNQNHCSAPNSPAEQSQNEQNQTDRVDQNQADRTASDPSS